MSASYPDVSLRAKEGGKPLRFITSHSRFALASAMRKTKRLRRRLGLCSDSESSLRKRLRNPKVTRSLLSRAHILVIVTFEFVHLTHDTLPIVSNFGNYINPTFLLN